MPDVVRLLITGVSNETTYSIIYQLCLTPIFAPKKLVLILFDFSRFEKYIFELANSFKNCNFPNIVDVRATCREAEAFANIHYAILINSNQDFTRKKTVQEVIVESAVLFRHFGRFLSSYTPTTCQVIVYDCQANLNTYFCRIGAQNFPSKNFTSVLVLSENRSAAQISLEIKTPPWGIKNIVVWGNSSFYQYADVKFATFDDKWVTKYATEHYRRHCLPRIVQRRSVEVMARRGVPAAMSPAFAVARHMQCLHQGTPPDEWITMGVVSDGSYGIEEGLVFGLPVRVVGGTWEVVPDLQLDEFTEENVMNALKNFKQSISLVMSSRQPL